MKKIGKLLSKGESKKYKRERERERERDRDRDRDRQTDREPTLLLKGKKTHTTSKRESPHNPKKERENPHYS